MMMAGQCTPHFLWSCQRKRAVHGPKEKRFFVLERDFRWKIPVKSLGAGMALLRLLPRSLRRTAAVVRGEKPTHSASVSAAAAPGGG